MKTSRLLVALLVGCGEAPYPDYWDADAVGPTVCAVSREVLTSTTGGKELVIGGTGLGGTTTVVIGGRNAQVVETTADSVTVLLPDAAPGVAQVDVTVVTDQGTATLENALTYDVTGRDWWADEVASATLYRIDCPVEASVYYESYGDYPMFWCGIETGYAYGYAFDGTGPQPGFAGDQADFVWLSQLPALGQTRLLGPGDRRPPKLPVLYGVHAEDEAFHIETPRDFERDLAFITEKEELLSETYYWADDITTWYGPQVFVYDDEVCYDVTASVEDGAEDILVLDEDLPGGTTGVVLGFAIEEKYGPNESYYSDGVTGTAWAAEVSGDEMVGGPSGLSLYYDGYSGFFFPDAIADNVGSSDLPSEADYLVSTTRLGEVTERGTVNSGAKFELYFPDLMTGDVAIDRTEDLELSWPANAESDDPVFVVVELVVYDVDIDDPVYWTEVARIVGNGDDTEGTLTIASEKLSLLPAAANMADDNDDLIGTWAELSVARHQLRKVAVDDGDLVIDFIHVVNAPVRLK